MCTFPSTYAFLLFSISVAVQLISVALLGLSILFIFAVFSFILWHNYFNNVHRFCETMVECYVSVIREGLLDTLGIVRYKIIILEIIVCTLTVTKPLHFTDDSNSIRQSI